MINNKSFIRYTWFIFAMVLLVILAGGVVRMTQSGMGCPDWPKCFGRWIPPTNASQLPPDFEKYLKQQDIDHSFNVYHTWIEYINRLLGALLGVFIFIHFIRSVKKFRRINSTIVWISFFMLLAVAFQGWLGKKVVDDNLAVVKVTIHMLVALLIAALPVLIISKLKNEKTETSGLLKNVTMLAMVVLLIQIILGTQVREQIDEISKSLNYSQRELWIERLDNIFLLHRSFSWIVALVCFIVVWKSRAYSQLKKHSTIIASLVIISVCTGLIMYFLNIPAIAQPLHLLMACLLILSLFSFRLQIK